MMKKGTFYMREEKLRSLLRSDLIVRCFYSFISALFLESRFNYSFKYSAVTLFYLCFPFDDTVIPSKFLLYTKLIFISAFPQTNEPS